MVRKFGKCQHVIKKISQALDPKPIGIHHTKAVILNTFTWKWVPLNSNVKWAPAAIFSPILIWPRRLLRGSLEREEYMRDTHPKGEQASPCLIKSPLALTTVVLSRWFSMLFPLQAVRIQIVQAVPFVAQRHFESPWWPVAWNLSSPGSSPSCVVSEIAIFLSCIFLQIKMHGFSSMFEVVFSWACSCLDMGKVTEHQIWSNVSRGVFRTAA